MIEYTEEVRLYCAAKSLTNAQIFGSLQVQGGGSGYTSTPSVTITGGGGSGATAAASIVGGVTGVVVTNGGSGYTSTPTIGFSGGSGSGVTAEAIINNGQVTAIRITKGGNNYTSPPSVSITGGGGSGATAQATMSVTSANRINQGSGYTSQPTVTISAPTGPNGGVTATAYAKVKDGSVESVFAAGDMDTLKGSSFLDFRDSENGNFSDMFVITSYENGDSPLLAFTQGIIMEKDLMVGGLLGSGQGTLWLNHGLVGRPKLSSPPCIGMRSSSIPYPSGSTLPSDPETGQLFNHNGTNKMWNGSSWVTGNFSGSYDTLFLFKFDGAERAHIDVGNATINGNATITGNASISGTLNVTNVVSVLQPNTDGTHGLGASDRKWGYVHTNTVYATTYYGNSGNSENAILHGKTTKVVLSSTAPSSPETGEMWLA